MNQEKIGNFIREHRKMNNLTQADLASKLGVTYQAVSKWETGKNIPDIAIIKELCKIFNVDINNILDGDSSSKNNNIINKKNSLILLVTIILIILLIFIIGHFIKKDNFEFKKISSNCNDFEVTGSMAYNNDFSSMYISDIDYCGEDIETLYKEIECILYESYNNIYTKIASCNFNNGYMTLIDYLDKVEFNVDNYSASCKEFRNSSLILEINAINMENKMISYKIPITLEDNCSK